MPETPKHAAQAIRDRIATLAARVGAEGAAVSEVGVVRLLDALAAALMTQEADVLVAHLRQDGGGEMLEPVRRVLTDELPASLGMVAGAYLDAAAEQISEPVRDEPKATSDAPDIDTVRASYLELLLRGDRHAASQLVLNAVDSGLMVPDLYRGVFQPALYEVGRLWQRNVVSVAQEHYITAATQLIMSQLYPRIFTTKRKGLRLIATCVSGELHEVGVRMVADFFEMDGWDTYYLGANVPPDEVVGEAKARKAHVLGVSATLVSHIPQVEAVVRAIQQDPSCERVRTLVGGQAFAFEPEAWQRVGAHAYAPTVDEAVRLANDWNKDAS